MRFWKTLCVLAIGICLAGSVYAETQSVKVSGDLTVRGILRDSYDYVGSPDETTIAGSLANIDSSTANWFMSVTEVEVDADMTDNVSTVIRLVNQRDWNVEARDINSVPGTAGHLSPIPNGRGGYTPDFDEFDIAVDLAYVTLKDFIYSPLTLTIGRQDLWFGKGFIVGLNQQFVGGGTGQIQGNQLTTIGSLAAPEYTAINSFDAFKAVLDYDPWTITALYSKILENAVQANDDTDLLGVNVGYKFDSYKAESEVYWFMKKNNSSGQLGGVKHGSDVHSIGIRGSLDPIDVVTLFGEGAFQAGQYVADRMAINSRSRSGWALDVGGEWRYFMSRYSWKPKIGGEYIFYSGQEDEDNTARAGGMYYGWDPMYRGKFDSAIREFVGRFYQTDRYPTDNQTGRIQSSRDASFTNQHQVIVMGSLQPIESLLLKANANFFWNVEKYILANNKSGGYIGTEVDLTANWDYTEDVSFNLLLGWFFPGEVYFDSRNDMATDIVGSVKVSF